MVLLRDAHFVISGIQHVSWTFRFMIIMNLMSHGLNFSTARSTVIPDFCVEKVTGFLSSKSISGSSWCRQNSFPALAFSDSSLLPSTTSSPYGYYSYYNFRKINRIFDANKLHSNRLNLRRHLSPDQTFLLNSNKEWEEKMRSMATDALLPVFYPPSNCQDNTNVLSRTTTKNERKPIDPEKSLKKLLQRYQKEAVSHRSSSSSAFSAVSKTTFEERQASRKRLSELVLGTSVMRIYHYNILLALQNLCTKEGVINGTNDIDLKYANDELSFEEPIFGVSELDIFSPFQRSEKKYSSIQDTALDNDSSCANRRNIVRSMVDLHAHHIQCKDEQSSSLPELRTQSDHVSEILDKIDDPVQRMSVQHSLPFFLSKMLVDQYGVTETEDLAESFNKSGPITIRRNFIKCQSDELLCKRLRDDDSVLAKPLFSVMKPDSDDSGMKHSLLKYKDQNIIKSERAPPLSSWSPQGCIRLEVNKSWSPYTKSIWSMQAWKDGWFEVQDVGSQLIVEATEAKCGETVVDFCAGNGGKTLALASLMWPGSNLSELDDDHLLCKSYIIAHDIVDERLRQLKGSLERVGLHRDMPFPSHIKVHTTLDSELQDQMADVVLVDAPCSSLGVLRRRPSQRFSLEEAEICSELPKLQLEILTEAARLVKRGGRLVYATCSISKYENENVVKEFETKNRIGIDWERWNFEDCNVQRKVEISNKEECENDFSNCRLLLPNLHESDGFFLARWRRF